MPSTSAKTAMTAKPAVSFARRDTGGVSAPDDVVAAFDGARRWLVIAPHDDDAVLGMGLAIVAATAAGVQVDVAIVSDGRMGYGTAAERDGIVERRAAETRDSLARVGVDADRIHWLGFPDSSLHAHQGATADGGIARALTTVMRGVRPDAVFAPTSADLHPDHRVVTSETDIAVFHAAGEIWLELGAALTRVPARWDYAVYCAFPEAPTLLARGDDAAFAAKVAAVEAYVSQRQIAALIASMRAAGPLETYLRRTWTPYRASDTLALFGAAGIADSGCQRDMVRAAAWVAAMPDQPWHELVAALKDRAAPPVLLVGEGSSRLFPAGFTLSLARRWGWFDRVAAASGRVAQTLDATKWRPVALSNSGRTREVMEFLAGATASKPLALVGLDGGPIPQAAAVKRVVLDRPEEAVAATISALGQALILAQALASAAGKAFPRERIAAGATQLVTADVPAPVRAALPGVKRVFWCGADDGVPAELALKTLEIAGVVGVAPEAGVVLHGLEEVLTETDLVVLIDPPRDDHGPLQKYLIDGTQARVVTLASAPAVGACWLQPELGEWSPPLRLVAGWRLLMHLAAALGRDPDKPDRARKVGNPIV